MRLFDGRCCISTKLVRKYDIKKGKAVVKAPAGDSGCHLTSSPAACGCSFSLLFSSLANFIVVLFYTFILQSLLYLCILGDGFGVVGVVASGQHSRYRQVCQGASIVSCLFYRWMRRCYSWRTCHSAFELFIFYLFNFEATEVVSEVTDG